jgi:D-alanyl-D-alanine carboxypeptidase (penicillin-binding protein 5/6)
VPLFAVVPALLGVVLAAYWLIGSSGGGPASDDSGPRQSVAVLGASCAPWQRCGATPAARTDPERTLAPVPREPTPVEEADPPRISAAAAVVMDEACGVVLYELNGGMRRPPASVTKILTALVAHDNSDLDDLVSISISGAEFSLETDSTVMGLEPGQTLTMRDLLYGLLLPSGNDAAIQIAEYIGGSVAGFARMMNARAAELGLENSHFTNPHGLDDPALYTSAYDMAILGRELLRRPALAEMVKAPVYQPAWDGPAVANINQLLSFYPGTLGVKTGYTDQAGQTIVAAAEQGDRRIIVSILGDQFDVYKDVSELLNWAFQSTATACEGGGLSVAQQ